MSYMYVCVIMDAVCLRMCLNLLAYINILVITCLGLKEVGIFRLPRSTTRVNELKELFNEGMFQSTPEPWHHRFVTQHKHMGICIWAETQSSQSFIVGAIFKVFP